MSNLIILSISMIRTLSFPASDANIISSTTHSTTLLSQEGCGAPPRPPPRTPFVLPLPPKNFPKKLIKTLANPEYRQF
jgi:hypothetical protein